MNPVHQNPVCDAYFADPFVWRSHETYYAIGTGELEATGRPIKGNIFPLLESPDFYHWHFAGNALIPPDTSLGTHYWAPEIAWDNNTFYLYYSVGQEDKDHQLRVATSNHPLGPFHDSGRALIPPSACPFAIDPHPFRDVDGRWFLFHARDCLDASPQARAGTALAVAPMKSMLELENKGQIILRARHDWQLFQSNRTLYGRVWNWHTLEGPFVLRHEGRYYCLYSGGRWDSDHYGIDYAVADHVTGPYSDEGGEGGPRVLRTAPGQLLGPGHCSVVLGPDGKREYVAYHAWDKDMTARRMFIQRLQWTAYGPRLET